MDSVWPTNQFTGSLYRARVFCGMRKVVNGMICGKSSAERSANYPLSIFRIPQLKNSTFLQIAKLPFARIVQLMIIFIDQHQSNW